MIYKVQGYEEIDPGNWGWSLVGTFAYGTEAGKWAKQRSRRTDRAHRVIGVERSTGKEEVLVEFNIK